MRVAAVLKDLNRRKVPRVGAAYLAIGLGTIYAADVILPRLGLPEWSVTLVIVLIGLGFPLALGLAWAFDLTGSGVERTAAADRGRAKTAEPPVGVDDPSAVPAEDGLAGIVVLPFSDMSPGGDHEYFSDGLTEEIIADLAGVGALSVISRTSAMCLKGTEKDVREIGRDLGVRYVLEGSVRVAGPRLRITAQLIDATTDAHVWAHKYDGDLEAVFEVQERVAREIVKALDVRLTRQEEARLSEHPVADVQAFELYLRARQRLRGYSTDGVEDLIARAMDIEGPTPPLRALRAWVKVTEVRAGVSRDGELQEAETEARDLVRSAPDAAYGHALLGTIAYERGKLALGVRHFDRALEFEPNDGDALFYQAICYNAAGKDAEVDRISARLLALDPLNPMAVMVDGIRHWFYGRAEEALPQVAHAVELDPGNLINRWCDGYTRALAGDLDGAGAQAEWLSRNAPRLPYTHQLTSLVAALRGQRDRALEILSGVDIAPLDGHHRFHLAESYAMAGDVERGLELLELGIDRGFYPFAYIDEHCPFLAPLRGTDEFSRIRDKAKQLHEAFDRELASIDVDDPMSEARG